MNPRTRSRRILLLLAAAVVAGAALGPGAAEAQRRAASRQAARQELIQRKRGEEQRRFASVLEEIAREREQAGATDQAAAIRQLAAAGRAAGMQLEALPERVQPPVSLELPEEERAWRLRLRAAREEHAQNTYLLAREFLNAGLPSSAYELIREAAQWNPDHPLARKLLGFERLGDRWVTPFAAAKLRTGHVWHERFGWLPKDHVVRYEQGERFYRGWKPAEQEAAIRRDFQHAWEVETEHFLIRTNHSLERGVEIATALEDYYQYFFETFAAFFQTREQMQRLFQGLSVGSSRGGLPSQKYVVHYFREKGEYVAALRAKLPQVAVSNGVYYPPDRIVYSYDDPEEEDSMRATLYHEASHQFFYESSSRDRAIGEQGHFWIVEGIACYLESYRREDGVVSVGDPRFIRFYWARRRLLDERYFVPLDRFSGMTMREFQSGAERELQQRYSQAAGLAHFLMHYDGGRYREPLVEYLAQVYRGDPRRPIPSLAELTGVPSAELDAQYQQYIAAMEQSLGPDDP